jgi:enterochelin esterase-like enzyme
MSPDSLAAEWVALAATVVAAVVLGVVWGNNRRWKRILARSAAVAACLATASTTGLIWVNRQVDTYPTWSSLIGSTPEAATPILDTPTGGATGTGQIISFTVAGKASKMTAAVYAYLPSGYASTPGARYPVVEALHGYPGSPLEWINKLSVAAILDHEISAGRMAPTVVLFPYQTPDPTLDTECTNNGNGVQAETFLTVDVPAAAHSRLHVRSDAAGWGLIGFSAGGYCASDLALRHPGGYAAGASLSGYANPGVHLDNGVETTTYNEIWRLQHLPIPAVALYLACARTDLTALHDTLALAKAARAPLSVTTSYVNGGGHNMQTWQAMEAPAFDWLSTSLGRPMMPASPASPAPTPPTPPVILSGAPRT